MTSVMFFQTKNPNNTLPNKDTVLQRVAGVGCSRYAISAVFMAANIIPFWLTTGPMQLNECDKLDQETLAEVQLSGVARCCFLRYMGTLLFIVYTICYCTFRCLPKWKVAGV